MSDEDGARKGIEGAQRLNEVIQSLDHAISGGLETLIPWIKAYAEEANVSDADYKGDHVLQKLVDAGYKTNDCMGPEFVKGNKEIMGRYIVGQVMHCLEGNTSLGKVAPPSFTVAFANRYISMPSSAAKKPRSGFQP